MCDSTIVLIWISSSPHRFKPFVSNRIAYIQERLPSSWNYIRSENNSADIVSRKLLRSAFCEHYSWLSGFSFFVIIFR